MSVFDSSELEGIWRKIDQRELEEMLESHEKFARGTAGGVRANLSLRDLAYLDLSGRDLSGATLNGARLKNANLSGTSFMERPSKSRAICVLPCPSRLLAHI